MGLSWGPLGGLGGISGAILEAIDHKGGKFFVSPRRGPQMSLLGPSWGDLGRSWGRLGGLLGPSWGSLGPSWGHLEASEAHRKRKGDFLSVWGRSWPLGSSVGGSRVTGSRLGAVLGPLGGMSEAILNLRWISCVILEAILCHLGGHLGRLGGLFGRLGAVLGPSWRPLGPSWGSLGGLLGAIGGQCWRPLGPS